MSLPIGRVSQSNVTLGTIVLVALAFLMASAAFANAEELPSPTAVYQEMLLLQSEGKWGETLELFDPASQKTMAKDIRNTLISRASSDNERKRLNAMDARSLLIEVGKIGTQLPTVILSEEINENEAILHAHIRKRGMMYQREVRLRLTEEGWRIIW